MRKQKRNRYSDEFKDEALKLAEKTSPATAARELGVHESQMYGWCSVSEELSSSGV
ncbi:transposase [Aidingimonas lacisalsi]|uniref:transposase n=1 Tax=Aidingimonas lacisalsi TaxID=2604086 RepID=UPI001375E584|nr:transposase [Aidingimonas lacisalsi]